MNKTGKRACKKTTSRCILQGLGIYAPLAVLPFFAKKHSMKIIHTLTCIFLFFALIPAINSYRQKREEPCCITYQVSTHDPYPHKLLISYQTENSLEAFFCYERKWEKQVYLSSKEKASIFVQDIFEPENGFIYLENERDSSYREWDIAPISVRILHKAQIKLTSGSKFLRLQL